MTTTTQQQPVSIADRVAGVIERDEVQLPPLPELAIKLKELIDREDSDARMVAELVKTEPAVVASLMRVANSVSFGGLRQVSDLGQAIARLGLKQVGTITTGLLLKGHFVTEPIKKTAYLHTLWNHSVATAFCARQFASRVGEDAEEAFMAGLLHDVGRLLVMKAFDHLDGQNLEVTITESVQREVVDTLHPELGHRALTRWNLPEAICDVVKKHENPPDTSEGLLLICVQAAELVSKKLGFHFDPDPELNLIDEPAIEALGLGDVELAELMIDLEDEFEEVHKLF